MKKIIPDAYVTVGIDFYKIFQLPFRLRSFFSASANPLADDKINIRIHKNNVELKFEGRRWLAKC